MNDRSAGRGLILPDYLEILLRFLVGGTFVYASFDKILHPEAFARAAAHYRLLNTWQLHPAAIYLPWLELVAGLAMIMGMARKGAALLTSLMTVMFIATIASALARDLDISCGCFHTEGAHAIGLSLLLRDVALLAGALVLLFNRGVRRSL